MTHSDSQTGTPVTLVVRPGTPGHVAPPPGTGPTHLPFSGFELVPALAVAALLVAAGAVLTAARRPHRGAPVRR
jgi:hypothetical protein